MRLGSLFSGYGGLEMGAEAAFGASTAWVSDIDPGACKILAHRYPDLPNHGDITKIDWTAVEPVDILTGGYPCQPFSHAGRRGGTNDERHLWPHVVEAMSALRPRFGVFENVRGHLSLGFDQVLRDLALLGYDTTWRVIRAADVGAPHGRARIFILATDRQLRSGSDRRGGLPRDLTREGSGHIHDPRSGGDGDEGLDGPDADAAGLRRANHATATGDGAERREGRVGAGRPAGVGLHRSDPAGAAPEDGPSGLLLGAVAVHLGEQDGDGSIPLGREAAPSCSTPDAQGAGGKPARTAGEPDAAAPRAGSAGRAPMGRVVGPGCFSVRTSTVCGTFPDGGPNGGGADLRDSDGFSYDADLVLVADSEGSARGAGQLNPAVIGGEGDGQFGRGTSQDTHGAARGERWKSAPGQAEGGRTRPYTGGRDRAPAADASGERHGRREDRREVGRVDGGAEGEARQRERARTESGDRGAEVAADTDSIGRSLDPKLHGDSASDSADRNPRGEHADGHSGAVAWGNYEPAIRRWERALGRVAPAPTETSSKGGERLSARLVEWMMGLPKGWVTDVPDLNRNAQLKALGNGVVPQQAYAAISRMLAA